MVGMSSRASKTNVPDIFLLPGSEHEYIGCDRRCVSGEEAFNFHSHAVTWRCFSQVVVFLYLLDEKTSLLVQVPAGIAAVIEVSSCYGAVNVGRISLFPGFHHRPVVGRLQVLYTASNRKLELWRA